MEQLTDPRSSGNNNFTLCTEDEMKRQVFPPDRQPSDRWLRDRRKRKDIPFVKIGGMVMYDAQQVRAAILKKFTVRSKHDA